MRTRFLLPAFVRPVAERLGALLGRRRLFLPVIGTLFGLAALLFVLVGLVDPLDLRPGGMKVRLADRPYADKVIPNIVSIAARDGTDLAVVGGSTSMAFTPAMLRAAFPEARKPVNLSFVAIRADEVATVLGRLEASPSLKRVLLAIDFTLIRDIAWTGRSLSPRLYGPRVWHDPVPEFDADILPLALSVVTRGVLDGPGTRRRDPELPDFLRATLPVTQRPEVFAKLRRAAQAGRTWVTSADELDCSHMSALEKTIGPYVRRMASRGIELELYFPPYSLSVYSDWTENFPEGHFFAGRGAPFANLSALRRCAVEAFDGVANLRLHAFDTDLSITADLSRYVDSTHLLDLEAYRVILQRIAARSSVLTRSTWPAFARSYREAVVGFAP